MKIEKIPITKITCPKCGFEKIYTEDKIFFTKENMIDFAEYYFLQKTVNKNDWSKEKTLDYWMPEGEINIQEFKMGDMNYIYIYLNHLINNNMEALM